ncbi:unnamed protein product [Paramecium octaurelia]|uniref:Uncharacterized protein n=1 Tax=Paramecium octaurelia TaxID=43137 RepID=A0A8S1YDR7_PAROT|nr:unnamed protein product [Paramecium octaurelia]
MSYHNLISLFFNQNHYIYHLIKHVKGIIIIAQINRYSKNIVISKVQRLYEWQQSQQISLSLKNQQTTKIRYMRQIMR